MNANYGQPNYGAAMPPYGTPAYAMPSDISHKKITAGICGILLGAFGVHKFVLGFNGAGIIMLLLALTVVGYPIMHIIGIIEGIMYLSKSDAEFYQTYVVARKSWF
jgi:TM2 domain-containing membrane protein YozV